MNIVFFSHQFISWFESIHNLNRTLMTDLLGRARPPGEVCGAAKRKLEPESKATSQKQIGLLRVVDKWGTPEAKWKVNRLEEKGGEILPNVFGVRAYRGLPRAARRGRKVPHEIDIRTLGVRQRIRSSMAGRTLSYSTGLSVGDAPHYEAE